MDHLTKTGYVLLCLLVPAAWGLLVEWVFHVTRTRRAGAADEAAAQTPGADRRSGDE